MTEQQMQKSQIVKQIKINLVYCIIKTCFFSFIIVIMSGRLPSYRKRRYPPQKFKHDIIHFELGKRLQQKCRICYLSSNLISICDCNFKYHQKCLLNWIRHRIKRALITQSVFNAGTLRCESPHCHKLISFTHEERYRYGCDYFCEKLAQNKCNTHLVLFIVLLIILGGFVFVAVYMSAEMEQTAGFVLFCAFSLMSLIVAIIMVGVLVVCFSKYFQVREIFLKSIVRPKRNRSEDGGSSSSSDENKMYENISQNFEIYVED